MGRILSIVTILIIFVSLNLVLPALAGIEAFRDTKDVFWACYSAFILFLLAFASAGFILLGCLGLALEPIKNEIISDPAGR